VLFLTPGYPSATDPISGVFVQRIADCLMSEEVQVTVINPMASIPLPSRLLTQGLRVRQQLPEFEKTASGISVYRPRFLSYPKSTIWGIAHRFIFRAVWKTLQQNQLQFDVLHGHWLYPMGYVAVMLGKRLGLPVCNTMRGDDITLMPYTTLGRARIEYVLTQSQYLTSVSQTLARQAQALVNVPVEFLANGALLSPSSPSPRQALRGHLRSQLGLDQDSFYVLFVGAITPAKGIDELAQTAAALATDRVKFLAIGHRLAGDRQYGLPRQVEIRGPQPPAVVLQYMQCCDVLAFPSHREGMPNVVVEAASVGLPVIATDVGGVAELIDESTGYLIPAKSASALQLALSVVLADYPAALKRADHARQRVAAHYDMMVNVRRLKTIYSNLVDRSPQSVI
jgi:teichuronic acid biosynthesis glycosyltransferase TuaC